MHEYFVYVDLFVHIDAWYLVTSKPYNKSYIFLIIVALYINPFL